MGSEITCRLRLPGSGTIQYGSSSSRAHIGDNTTYTPPNQCNGEHLRRLEFLEETEREREQAAHELGKASQVAVDQIAVIEWQIQDAEARMQEEMMEHIRSRQPTIDPTLMQEHMHETLRVEVETIRREVSQQASNGAHIQEGDIRNYGHSLHCRDYAHVRQTEVGRAHRG